MQMIDILEDEQSIESHDQCKRHLIAARNNLIEVMRIRFDRLMIDYLMFFDLIE